jgi:hypothetical protein
LPQPVFVDVGLRLAALQDRPADKLLRAEAPYPGMNYLFTLIDPDNWLAEYRFGFYVLYGQDEETLHVVNGICRVSFGW